MITFIHRNCLYFILFFGTISHVFANHIVGGELQMRRVGGANTFEVTLIQFWDQNNLTIPTPLQVGNRDEEAELLIFRKKDRQFMTAVTARYLSTETMTYQNKACASSRSINTSIGLYKGSVTLAPQLFDDPEGYYIAWERCCRNGDINNIKVPGDNGMVFYLEFPPIGIVNHSPEFVAPNGQYICSNRQFTMNMSATDADGDELRYSLVTPMRGTTTPDQPTTDNSFKSSYPLVEWVNGISNANIIPGPSPLKISNAGVLTVTAGQLGLYVFTVQCEEYRNGIRIGLVRRDFQLLVIDCNDDQPAAPVIMYQAQPTTEVKFCPGRSVELTTESATDWSYQWQLNGLNIPGATGASIAVADTGRYSVIKSYTKKCSRDTSSQVVNVSLGTPVKAELTADREIFCPGETVALMANGGTLASGHSLSWTKDNAAFPGTAALISISEPGMYCIMVENASVGCAGMDTLVIEQEQMEMTLQERKGLLRGSSTQIVPLVKPAPNDFTYSWSPPEGIASDANMPDIRVSPLTETTYTLTVTSANGCMVQDSILIYIVDKMHIPDAFSPNNDGRNDTFEIFNSKDQIEEVRIYSRWGELVFFSEGYATPWDGNYKGRPVPAGAYPYIIKGLDQEVKGSVLILR